ncbi:hypothetical protein [Sphingomonas alba]|uniref:Replication protein n=1 Tax=Sphingomonas alba TaxID=2908208 RepID=A0ABT0RN44_9SPHN|nr:hypothetical protein [Sphingomonas alba]MCL6683983.1 hypothetical protein [Sphingomonas alba]
MPVNTGRKQADWSADTRALARPRVKASNNPESAVFRSRKKAGTTLAFKGIDTSSAMHQPVATLRRGRRSTGLRKRDVENILAAGDNTPREHRGFNRFTTIHFEAAKIADPVWAIGRLMKLAGDWLRTKGEALRYIWVREAGDGKGDHVHILWYVPPLLSREFAKRERGWRKLMGAKPCKRAFKSVPVGMSLKHSIYEIQFGQHYSDALRGVLEYIVKGAEPKAAEALGLALRRPGGELWGKRYGMSENINRTARSRLLK